MVRLEHVVARNVIALRQQIGATQAELAAKMRASGFTWQTNRVAQIETLRRPVSLLEVVGLARVFGVPVTQLLDGDDQIDLPSGGAMPLGGVRDALAGVLFAEVRDATPDELREHQAAAEELRKMAKQLDVPSNVLDGLAYRCFGQSFRAEREKRLGVVAGMSARSAQTKRGHVSRRLLAELQEWLGDPDQRARIIGEYEREVADALANIEGDD